MNNILEIFDLNHSFDKEVYVLNNINLTVKSGEILSILGPSGCGKTTLLRIIAGLEKQANGIIKINNKIVSDQSCFIPPEKRNLGLIVQERSLFPHLTNYENILFGIKNLDDKNEIARDYLELFKIAHLKDKYPHEISGGEQQRIALARSLAPCPALLLMDEPFNALDEKLKIEMYAEIKKIFRQKNITVIMVSHDNEEARFFSDKIYEIDGGILSQLITK
tara:strand:- start:80 stop:742 length:663 start_codon:yes stop_codon:yes gene_type:complete